MRSGDWPFSFAKAARRRVAYGLSGSLDQPQGLKTHQKSAHHDRGKTCFSAVKTDISARRDMYEGRVVAPSSGLITFARNTYGRRVAPISLFCRNNIRPSTADYTAWLSASTARMASATSWAVKSERRFLSVSASLLASSPTFSRSSRLTPSRCSSCSVVGMPIRR